MFCIKVRRLIWKTETLSGYTLLIPKDVTQVDAAIKWVGAQAPRNYTYNQYLWMLQLRLLLDQLTDDRPHVWGLGANRNQEGQLKSYAEFQQLPDKRVVNFRELANTPEVKINPPFVFGTPRWVPKIIAPWSHQFETDLPGYSLFFGKPYPIHKSDAEKPGEWSRGDIRTRDALLLGSFEKTVMITALMWTSSFRQVHQTQASKSDSPKLYCSPREVAGRTSPAATDLLETEACHQIRPR